MAWNDIEQGTLCKNPPKEGAPGASLYIPFTLGPGESHTIRLHMVWYVPYSGINYGPDAETDADRGVKYNPAQYENYPTVYEPWYGHRFPDIRSVCDYWLNNYGRLKSETESFTEAFYSSTLPPEVIEAVAANLTILKSPTVWRQHDGRMWNWEGSGDTWGSCHGSCTHVWNYAQALPHLFPAMERTLRETEFLVGQNSEGHQVFRNNLPIRPTRHDFHAAADGQLGGILKAYRDWRSAATRNGLPGYIRFSYKVSTTVSVHGTRAKRGHSKNRTTIPMTSSSGGLTVCVRASMPRRSMQSQRSEKLSVTILHATMRCSGRACVTSKIGFTMANILLSGDVAGTRRSRSDTGDDFP